jgi:hypothetical protein
MQTASGSLQNHLAVSESTLGRNYSVVTGGVIAPTVMVVPFGKVTVTSSAVPLVPRTTQRAVV